MANAEKIAKLSEPRHVKKVLKYAVNKKDEIRAAAFEALGNFTTDDANNMLIAGIKDPSPLCRQKAAESLGKIGSAHSYEFIRHRLAVETDAAVISALEKAQSATRSLD